MFKFENITKEFRVDFWAPKIRALNQLCFDIKPEKISGFLGANGAGKTTAIKILLGFINSSSGEVKFSSDLGKNKNEILQNLGHLPERPYFYPYLTGKEFIEYMGRLSSVPENLIVKNAEFWGERFKIKFAYDRKIKNYSKGMLQRLGFVCTLLHDPKLVILDEPLSGLDPIGRKELKDAMIEINNQGKTVFFSSHIIPDVEEICHDVVFIEKGQSVFQGSVESIIKKHFKSEFEVKVKGSHSLNTSVNYKELYKRDIGGWKNYLVNEKDIDAFLKDALNSKLSVKSLRQHNPGLEEIFYNIKSNSDTTS